MGPTAFAAYKPPTNGIFPYLPDSWVPYAELMRLDRLAGFWAFYWHYLIGIGYALNVSPQPPANILTVLALTFYTYIFVTVIRGAACSINDNLDQGYDRQVTRTRFRPIARGAISTMAGHLFTCALLVVGAALIFPAPAVAAWHAAFDTVLLFVYPLLKRVTNFPQVELGFALSYPVFTMTAAISHIPWPLSCSSHITPLPDSEVQAANIEVISSSSISLYLAGILWAIICDTIYAHQDYEDDLKAGVRGLAVLLGRKRTKPAMAVLSVLQVTFLIACGVSAKFGPVYYVIACGGTALSLAHMLINVNLYDGASCAWAFGPGSRPVGMSVTTGLFLEFLIKSRLGNAC